VTYIFSTLYVHIEYCKRHLFCWKCEQTGGQTEVYYRSFGSRCHPDDANICQKKNIHESCRSVALTSWLTPWSRVLLGKPNVPQRVKKLVPFYGTQIFITAFTKVRNLSLSWGLPLCFIKINFSIWHLSTPRSSKWLFSTRYSTQTPVCMHLLPLRVTCRTPFHLFAFITLVILNH
jgi:cytochrome c-type biogenesis protein CcmH/NrfF